MKRNIMHASLVFALALVVGSCTKNAAKEGDTVIVMKQTAGETLAQVGSTKMTLEALREDFLSRQGSFRGAPNLNTEKARQDYIDNQVMQEAMFKKAIELGYFDRPEVLREVKKVVVQRLVRDKLETAQSQFVPTEEQMKEHYDKNKNFYNRADAVKVAYISIPFGADKNKTKEIADAMHKDALASVKNSNTREFSRIAMRHAQKLMTISKISVETNETDYLDKAEFEAKFGANTFDKTKEKDGVGEIKELITTKDAFVIMMKTGSRKALNESFADAKPKIIKRLAYEGRNDFYKKFMDDLRAEYKITVNKERLAELSKDDKPKVAKTDAPSGAVPMQMPPQGAPNNAAANMGLPTPTEQVPAKTAQQTEPAPSKDPEGNN